MINFFAIKRLFVLLPIIYCQASFAATPKVSFIEPKNGALVEQTFKVRMKIQGMKLCTANIETADKECGHHHIIVDGASVAKGEVIINDANHLHYGNEQTEAELKLSPGKHTLTLQFADFAHKSYGKQLASTIKIEVKPEKMP